MKVLIVENELYLAQSIAAKLIDVGCQCEFASTLKDALRDEHFDVVLLSTNISDQNFYPVIERYKESIIILMVSYINNDTVSKPLQAGASDYILKPFMIEELIRKIEHFRSYRRLKRQNAVLQSYIEHTFANLKIDISVKQELPLLIRTNHQKSADHFAFELARQKGYEFIFFPLGKFSGYEELHIDDRTLLYLSDFQTLKKPEKQELLEFVKNKNVIIASTDLSETPEEISSIEIKTNNKSYDDGEIMSIEEYVKYILIMYQSKFPDTELSKKLGISRKSLWEKRKKYGIVKKHAKKS